jgi:formylglycine-generating enzyme required for sulfatase activity
MAMAAAFLACALLSSPWAWAQPVEILKNGLGIYFRHVPAGRFNMGAGPDFHGEPQYETPAHQVAITKPFRLAIHEVTIGQWLQVMGTEPARRKGPMNPVVNVSWDDVHLFLDKLSQADGQRYRLPTEAEWEYAARAGTTTAFYYGSDAERLVDYAWCAGDAAKGETKPVAQKPANPWGFFDMYGNAAEWVADWFGEDYYAKGPASDPKGPDSGSERSVRGGSYASDPKACQSAWRDADLPMVRSGFLGFRLAYEE